MSLDDFSVLERRIIAVGRIFVLPSKGDLLHKRHSCAAVGECPVACAFALWLCPFHMTAICVDEDSDTCSQLEASGSHYSCSLHLCGHRHCLLRVWRWDADAHADPNGSATPSPTSLPTLISTKLPTSSPTSVPTPIHTGSPMPSPTSGSHAVPNWVGHAVTHIGSQAVAHAIRRALRAPASEGQLPVGGAGTRCWGGGLICFSS